MIRKFLFIACVFISELAASQDVTFTAQGPGVVQVAERFRLTYALNTKPSGFYAPNFDNFYVVAGPSTSTSTSIEMVNGKVKHSQSITYTYILEAQKEGKFTISPARVTVGRNEYASNAVTIEVIADEQQAAASRNAVQTTAGQQQTATNSSLPNEELFVAVELNKHTAYLGEPILATFKVYTRVDISGFESVKYPSFNNFWCQELPMSNQITFQRANVNGKIYNVGIIGKYLLFPQKSPSLQIDPFELNVLYNAPSSRPRSIFDDFFGVTETRRKKLVSRPINLNIKPLPDGAPAAFDGAVGNFKMKTTVDKTQLKANEAVTMKVNISGSGNMKLIGMPTVSFPAGFEQFDPKTTNNFAAKAGNMSGTKTIEYIVIPRTSGVYEIPPVQFAYFDLNKKSYVTLSSEGYQLNVAADTSAHSVVVSGYSKEDVKFIGQDIRFIKTDAPQLKPRHRFVVVNGMYQLTYAVVFVLFVGFVLFYRKHRSQMADQALMRTRKANKAAQKRLKTANTMLAANNSEKFYEEISRAMSGYVADKLGIPMASLTLDHVNDTLAERNVEQTQIDEYNQIMNTCEFARFSPMAQHEQMDQLYDQAYKLIAKFEQVLKTAKYR